MKVFFSFFLAQFWIFAHFFRSFSFVIAGEEEELMGANGEQHGSGSPRNIMKANLGQHMQDTPRVTPREGEKEK